ncbi:mitochondrial substrate carrier protein [Grosmannia clavigera kw1407]|uniref:Mitochondrial substrate carrier protein n=1 Tax=Grosmannia clavigera (strain kw1407 / UAMH 11150) TaxID=655863 RepID=F0XE59_GROCL|nr:mitochondrial substrate carrier protein [Grosmannia clavigera kw1407]EFX03598.1 mitochondrial substrate carrier protein [Grosmannia clavigera kw1407]
MSSPDDVERRPIVHEETPLLRADTGADAATEDEGRKEDIERTPARWYVWRALWAVAAAVVVALFVKGWINAGGDVDFDLKGALKRALGGGLSGAAAMILQVLLLMPLRTIMNYQYRFGHSFTAASRILYEDGGYGRYYQGLGAALVQGPVSRFGDTAANAGILALLHSNSYLKDLPSFIQTVFASLCAACFRMTLTPIDTLKTTLQAQGARGTNLLRQRIKTDGVGSLWWGAIATAAATFVGHYPWFATYNFLSGAIPEPAKHPIIVWLLRLAFIGFIASIISDSVSNSLRVVKTYRQVNETKVSYTEAARLVVLEDGLPGLFGRGLKTRILCNGLQGLLFSILWKVFLDLQSTSYTTNFAAKQESFQAGLLSLFSGNTEDTEADLSKLFHPTFTQQDNDGMRDFPAFVEHIRHLRKILPSVFLVVTQFLRDGTQFADRHISSTTLPDGTVGGAETFMFGEVAEDGRLVWLSEIVRRQELTEDEIRMLEK